MTINHQLSLDLLGQPAKRAARVVARARLDAVRDAYGRFVADAPDALHDLRVGLRRLRSWLRAFRPELDDTVGGKTRRRLRDLARATNAARDTEVWTEWIGAQTRVTPRARPGQRYVVRWLRGEGDDQGRKATKRLRARLPQLMDRLEEELSSYTAPVDADGPAAPQATMADTIADLIRHHYQRFTRRMGRIDSGRDVRAIHQCRIAAKQLRYLLEALDELPEAREATGQLVEVQDALGTVRDMRLFVERIVERVGIIAMMEARRRAAKALRTETDDTSRASLSRVRPGMLRLAKRASNEADADFETFHAAWDQTRLDATAETLDRLAAALGAG